MSGFTKLFVLPNNTYQKLRKNPILNLDPSKITHLNVEQVNFSDAEKVENYNRSTQCSTHQLKCQNDCDCSLSTTCQNPNTLCSTSAKLKAGQNNNLRSSKSKQLPLSPTSNDHISVTRYKQQPAQSTSQLPQPQASLQSIQPRDSRANNNSIVVSDFEEERNGANFRGGRPLGEDLFHTANDETFERNRTRVGGRTHGQSDFFHSANAGSVPGFRGRTLGESDFFHSANAGSVPGFRGRTLGESDFFRTANAGSVRDTGRTNNFYSATERPQFPRDEGDRISSIYADTDDMNSTLTNDADVIREAISRVPQRIAAISTRRFPPPRYNSSFGPFLNEISSDINTESETDTTPVNITVSVNNQNDDINEALRQIPAYINNIPRYVPFSPLYTSERIAGVQNRDSLLTEDNLTIPGRRNYWQYPAPATNPPVQPRAITPPLQTPAQSRGISQSSQTTHPVINECNINEAARNRVISQIKECPPPQNVIRRGPPTRSLQFPLRVEECPPPLPTIPRQPPEQENIRPFDADGGNNTIIEVQPENIIPEPEVEHSPPKTPPPLPQITGNENQVVDVTHDKQPIAREPTEITEDLNPQNPLDNVSNHDEIPANVNPDNNTTDYLHDFLETLDNDTIREEAKKAAEKDKEEKEKDDSYSQNTTIAADDINKAISKVPENIDNQFSYSSGEEERNRFRPVPAVPQPGTQVPNQPAPGEPQYSYDSEGTRQPSQPSGDYLPTDPQYSYVPNPTDQDPQPSTSGTQYLPTDQQYSYDPYGSDGQPQPSTSGIKSKRRKDSSSDSPHRLSKNPARDRSPIGRSTNRNGGKQTPKKSTKPPVKKEKPKPKKTTGSTVKKENAKKSSGHTGKPSTKPEKSVGDKTDKKRKDISSNSGTSSSSGKYLQNRTKKNPLPKKKKKEIIPQAPSRPTPREKEKRKHGDPDLTDEIVQDAVTKRRMITKPKKKTSTVKRTQSLPKKKSTSTDAPIKRTQSLSNKNNTSTNTPITETQSLSKKKSTSTNAPIRKTKSLPKKKSVPTPVKRRTPYLMLGF